MKALLLIVGWLGCGLLLCAREHFTGVRRPAWERVLALVFWPFFLVGGSAPAAPADAAPIARLRAALAPDDPAQGLVSELAAALRRQQERVARLDGALAAAGDTGGPQDAPLAEARTRSRQLLAAARAREGEALGEALAAIEEAATRLWLLREGGERGEVEALLGGLAARLRAGEEVEGRASQG